MVFSTAKYNLLKDTSEKRLSTFLLAIGLACTFFVPYMIMSEGYFTFFGDFNVQQIPFYQQCHKAILEGNIFWSWTTDLGANFIGSYSFYLLGSPFFWITLLFPNSFVPYLMGPLFILKFGCAALTAYLYIRRFTRTAEAARLGGILYAFSGFSIYNVFFNHFHEAIIVFPLLLLSFELLITENRRFCFALTVCLCAITNYFFFFGMVVFTVIYFLVRLFSKAIKITFSRFLVLVFEAVLGLLISAVVLLPAIMAITGNYRVSQILLGWNAIMYGKEQIYGNILQCFFFPPDLPARPVFFPGAEVKWSSLGGWLPLFSMVGVFAWFSERKGHWLKRLIGICIFMALVPILNSAFYAFNTSFYTRWFYMPILMMCLCTVVLAEDRDINWSFGYKWVLGITLAVTLVIGLFPQKDSEGNLIFGLHTQGEDNIYLLRFWVTCAIAIVSLIILWLLLKLYKNNPKSFMRSSLAVTCILIIIYANFFIASGRAHSYEIKEVMIDKLIEGEVDLEDNSNFRVDVYDGVDNTSMYLGLPGINAFHSVVPKSIFDFYKYIGIKRSVGSRPDTNYSALRPLLSVKYLLNRTDGDPFINEETRETLMPDYSYVKTDGGYYIYENENYIPYGFSYDYYMSYDFCDDYNETDRPSLMLKAILLTDEQIEKYGHLMEDIDTISSFSPDDEELTLSTSDTAMRYDCRRLAKTSALDFEIDNRGFTATVAREKESLVFFSVPYDEGWSATVNGQAAEIEKVNTGFMAIKVPKGESEIRFNYMTPYLFKGIKITTISASVLLIYAIIWLIISKKGNGVTLYPEGDELLKKWRIDIINEEALKYVPEEDEATSEKPNILDIGEINTPPSHQFDGGFKISSDIFSDSEADTE